MSCVLRIYGEHLDIDALLVGVKLTPIVTWRKGEKRIAKGQFRVNSGANFVISDADFEDIAQQIVDAESYLEANHGDIAKLTSRADVADATLDFAVATRPGFATQTSDFSPGFLQRLASLKIGLAVSHYATADDVAE